MLTKKQIIELQKEHGTDAEIGRAVGLTRERIRQYREIYSIPKGRRALLKKNKFNIRKTREELGCSYQHVRNMLFRYGISLTGLTHDKDCNGS